LTRDPQRPLTICDITQFYSPVSGGIRRYIEQKSAFLRTHRPDCRHIVIVPGEKTAVHEDGPVRFHTIASQLVSRTSRYRLLTKLHLIEEIFERERPHIIESGDSYQVAWKTVASGRGLDIPVVGFYHSHFPESVLRTVTKFFGPLAASIVAETCRKYVTTLYNHFECTFVPSPALAKLLGRWGVENTHTVDLGVDDSIFRPDINDRAATRSKLGIPDSAPLLLYVGRLAPEKMFKPSSTPSRTSKKPRANHGNSSASATAPAAPTCSNSRGAPMASTGHPIARFQLNSPPFTARPTFSCTRAFRKPSASSPWKVRHAEPPLSASAAATWTASFLPIKGIGHRRIPPKPLPKRSSPNSAQTSAPRDSAPAPKPAHATRGTPCFRD
jgi:hypothetical protein